MSVLHDLTCPNGHILRDAHVRPGALPPCQRCGQPTSITLELWTTVHGDKPEQPFYSDAAGRWFDTQRDQDKHMRKLGYFPAGDKVHGGRNDSRPKRTAFSFGGNESRRSTEERNYGASHVAPPPRGR